MKFTLLKDIFLTKLNLASKFVSNRLSSISALQGVLIEIKKNEMHFYATNLNSYLHTTLKIDVKEEIRFVVDPKRIAEFVSLIQAPELSFEIKSNQFLIFSGKTKGIFPLINIEDFPPLPKIPDGKHFIKKTFLENNLPLVLFAASSDETRPTLTGVNFLSTGDELSIVTTDGFRLSLIKTEKQKGFSFPSLIIPAEFLSQILSFLKVDKNKNIDISFGFSKEEKAVVFTVEGSEFYSRLIEGDFPPFEKVIPNETNTKVKVSKEELIRNIKLASVFARDYSNIVIFDVRKDGLYIKPRIDNNTDEDTAFQESEFEGAEQKIAFNFRFLLDFLNHVEEEKVGIELARPDAPAIFKLENKPNFIHLIMPVRIEMG